MNEEKDEIVKVDENNQEMLKAVEAARGSLAQFFQTFSNPGGNQESFLLKVAFEHEGSVEHIWLSDLDLTTDPPTGIVANVPGITSLVFMQRTPFTRDRISDWMYVEDGFLVGGFTNRVLIDMLPPDEKAEMLQSSRFKREA